MAIVRVRASRQQLTNSVADVSSTVTGHRFYWSVLSHTLSSQLSPSPLQLLSIQPLSALTQAQQQLLVPIDCRLLHYYHRHSLVDTTVKTSCHAICTLLVLVVAIKSTAEVLAGREEGSIRFPGHE